MRFEAKQTKFIKEKISCQRKFKNIEEEKRKYIERLKKGRPEEIKERREKIYKGTTLESEKIESKKQPPTGEIDLKSYKEAYGQWLIKPEGPKPELKDFAVEKISAENEDNQEIQK